MYGSFILNKEWEALIGLSITDPKHSFMFISLEESWLKQLYVQYMIGIDEPILRLPGVLGKFKTNSEFYIPALRFVGQGFNLGITANRINEPGCEWQLKLIRRKH